VQCESKELITSDGVTNDSAEKLCWLKIMLRCLTSLSYQTCKIERG
jgi:hypothetical protein